jgi:hypothetical protein
MSVDDSASVDAIGIDRTTDEAVLSISDHREWNDPEHLGVLQTKLNTYLAFIESGEVFKSYPAARSRKLRIDVVCKFEPDGTGGEFLAKAQSIIRDAGFSLTWRVPNKPMQATCEHARA